MTMAYSPFLRSTMVRRMAGPNGLTASALERETAIPQETLSRWLRAAGSVASMTESNEPAERRPSDISAEEIFVIVTEAAGLSDEELGAYLRGKGLHATHLEQWRAQIMAGLTAPARRPARSAEVQRIKELERELRRKDKALAETAALLVLQKKMREIWGDEEDHTPPKSGA